MDFFLGRHVERTNLHPTPEDVGEDIFYELLVLRAIQCFRMQRIFETKFYGIAFHSSELAALKDERERSVAGLDLLEHLRPLTAHVLKAQDWNASKHGPFGLNGFHGYGDS